MRCEIKHWDDNKYKTTPLTFRGRAWRTAVRYLRFLDDTKTTALLDSFKKFLLE